MTDAELLARFVRSTDQAAFAEIVRRHAGLVVGAARRLAPADADDVAQATFFLLAQRAPKLLGRTSIAGWLYETARGCARNARRGRLRHERKLAAARADERSSAASLNADVVALLDDAIARLPSAVRDVVLLRHVESLTVAETAERLGVAATTVTKRSERGLSRLRDFFAARGHATLGVAGVTTLLVMPTAHVDAATLATAATGKATPAVAALAAAPAVPAAALAAAAAISIVAAAAVTVGVRANAPSPAVAATRPVIAPLPTPPTPPLAASAAVTEEAGKATATAFLDALRDGAAPAMAAVWSGDGDPNAAAAALIRDVRNGPYAAFPQRLSLGGNGSFEMEPTIFNADGTTQPTSPGGPRLIKATLESQTPTEADIGRLLIQLNVVDGAWKIGTAKFVYFDQRPTEPRGPVGPPSDVAAVRAAAAAWSRVQAAQASLPELAALTDAEVPKVRAAMVETGDAVNAFAGALRNSPLAARDEDARAVRATTAEIVATIDRAPAAADVAAYVKDPARFEKVSSAFDRLSAIAGSLDDALDSADEAHPATTRPASVGADASVRIPWLNDEVVRLRGPITFPEWLRDTRAWKRWEQQHDIRMFRTRDDAGNAYEVDVSGAAFEPGKDTNGRTSPNIRAIRRFRPNGTLAAIADYQFGVGLSAWGEFDETGRRYTYRVSTRAGYVEHPSALNDVTFFAADGAMRRWHIEGDERNRVYWESVSDPIGDHEQTIHLMRNDGTDDGKPEDDLPIDGLPIERD